MTPPTKKFFVRFALGIITVIAGVVLAATGLYVYHRSQAFTVAENQIKEWKSQAWVPISAKNQVLINALVAAEDPRFFRRQNDNTESPLLYMAAKLVMKDHLEDGRTLQRHFYNYFGMNYLATQSKELILEIILNKSLLQLADEYFNKPVESFGLSQTALLAGLIRSPNFFDPVQHPDRAKDRRDIVLEKMWDEEMISEAEKEMAIKAPLL